MLPITSGLRLWVAATFLVGCSGPGNSNIGMVMGGTAGVVVNTGAGNGGGLNAGGGIAGTHGGETSGGEAGSASGGTAGTNGGAAGTGGNSEGVPDASTSPQGGDSGQEPNMPTCPTGATDAENGLLIEVDGTYGFYAVAEIIILDGAAGAPCGRYTFHVASPTAGEVTLQRDGVPVATTTYFWRETISATDPTMFHSFQFGGYFFITIRKAGMGTINLGGMDQSIFDGMRVLLIP